MKRAAAEDSGEDSGEESEGGIPLQGTWDGRTGGNGEELSEEDEGDAGPAASQAPKAGKASKASKASKAKNRKGGAAQGRAADGEEEDEDDDDDVTFEFQDPGENHYHAIRGMIRDFLPGSPVNMADLTNSIATQPEVGTLILQEKGEDIFALATALHLGPHQDAPVFTQIRDYLRSITPDEHSGAMEELLVGKDAEGVGLLVCEHMINLPLPLIPTLYDSLRLDIQWAMENAEDAAEEREFRFEKLILISPFSSVEAEALTENPPSGAGEGPAKKKKKKGSSSSSAAAQSSPGAVFYKKIADEFIVAEASFVFNFSASVSSMDGKEKRQFTLSMLSLESYCTAVRKMADALR